MQALSGQCRQNHACRRWHAIFRSGVSVTLRRSGAYPHKQSEDILRDLTASEPGAKGKWFAATKEAGLYDLAIELVAHSPADPRTLTRAAKDYAGERPQFAVAAGVAALRWISLGHGYEITSLEVLDAYTAVLQAACGAGMDEHVIRAQIYDLIAGPEPNKQFMRTVLVHHLPN